MKTKARADKVVSQAKSVQKVVGQGKTGKNLTPRHRGGQNTGWGGVGPAGR